MFDLEWTEEQKLVHDTVSNFARSEIRGIARECDESGSIPPELLGKGFELGLIHSALPEEHGGFGEERSAVTGAIVAEELAWGDLSISLAMLAPRLLAYPVADLGTPEQKREILPRFAQAYHPATAAFLEPRFDFDPERPATTAERSDGDWIITGRKCFVPLAAEADLLLVLARAGDGPAAFVVERGAPGVTVSEREKNMGIKALATHEISFEGVRVPAGARLGGEAGADLGPLLDRMRVALAAMAVGVARASYEFARDYAKERKAFGVPIAQKQAIAFMLADMAIEIDASRLLVWEAAWLLDEGREARKEAFLAKRYAASAALKIADNAVQVLGGHGYIRDYPVELWLRNARGFSSFEGMAVV